MNLANDLKLLYAFWPATDALWLPKSGQGGSGRAILDCPGTLLLGGEVLATDYGLRYPSSAFPCVRQGDRFVVDAVTYSARENAQPTLDGFEHTVPLARVA